MRILHRAQQALLLKVRTLLADFAGIDQLFVFLVPVLKPARADQFRGSRRRNGIARIGNQERSVLAANKYRGVKGLERIAFRADIQILADIDEGGNIRIARA